MRAAAVVLALGLSGCAAWQNRAACRPGETPMVVNELFFGRDIAGRAPLTEAEWSAFADSVVAKEFPDGFTVMDGEGRWRDSATGMAVREQSKIVLVAAPHDTGLDARIARLREAYRTAFHQSSVGVLAYEACGAF